MLESVLVTAEQTAMLFVLMGFGMLARRFGVLDLGAVRSLTKLVVNITTPCIIVTAFQCPYDTARLPALGWSALIAAGWYVFAIGLSRLCFRGDSAVSKAYGWSVIFSNCGFMGLPLEYALFGADGVFYGVAPIAMFNLFAWTYGVAIFRPLEGGRDLLRGILNPANIGLGVALVLFFLPWRLPAILASPVKMVGEMNTPLPMFIMGYYLGGAKFSAAFRNCGTYVMLSLRHLVVPGVVILALAFCTFIPLDLRLIAVVPAAAPIGVLLTVFAVQFDGDAEFSTALVSVSTLLSMFTIPLMIAIARLFL